jgi:CRISPR-associated protein Csm3
MEIITINSRLKLVSGLHIGGADDSMKIGGVDSPVIKREISCNSTGEIGFGDSYKHKITEPYIPGSSLKGKIRSLLEHYFRLIDPNGRGRVIDSSSNFGDSKKRDMIIKLFGESAGENKSSNITRFLFRDCFITNNVRKAFVQNKISLSEEKFENVIDRKTGTTINGGLRQIERVPSGVDFDFDVSIRIFEGDNKELFENILKLGLKLLELDALGGSGSRGYGKIKFVNIQDDINTLSQAVNKEI